jgi:hypothetical protein
VSELSIPGKAGLILAVSGHCPSGASVWRSPVPGTGMAYLCPSHSSSGCGAVGKLGGEGVPSLFSSPGSDEKEILSHQGPSDFQTLSCLGPSGSHTSNF